MNAGPQLHNAFITAGTLSQRGFEHWLRLAFSQLFVAWIHLKAIRVFVESALRSVLTGLEPVKWFCRTCLT